MLADKTLTSDYIKHLQQLHEILDRFRSAGVSLINEPHTNRDFKRIEIVNTPLSTISPKKAAKGITSMTTKTMYMYDKVLDAVIDIISDMCKDYGHIQDPRVLIPDTNKRGLRVVTTQSYRYIQVTPSGLFYIPVDRTMKVTEPVYVILNFDKSVIDPGDIGPSFKYLPLSRVGNVQTLALFTTVWWLFMTFNKYEIMAFITQTDSTAGLTALLQMIKDDSSIKPVFATTSDMILSMMNTFSALKWLGNIMRRQVNLNASYQSILEVLQDPKRLEQYRELKAQAVAIQKVKKICKEHKPKFEEKITELEYTIFLKSRGSEGSFNVGPITHVTTRKMRMSSDGAYVTVSYEVKPEVTERLLKSVRFFKQKVRSLNFFIGRDFSKYDNIVTVRIPTANWDSAQALEDDFSGDTGFKIVQETRNSQIFSQDAPSIFSTLQQHFSSPDTIGASVSWDATSGKGSLKVSKLYTEEVH